MYAVKQKKILTSTARIQIENTCLNLPQTKTNQAILNILFVL